MPSICHATQLCELAGVIFCRYSIEVKIKKTSKPLLLHTVHVLKYCFVYIRHHKMVLLNVENNRIQILKTNLAVFYNFGAICGTKANPM